MRGWALEFGKICQETTKSVQLWGVWQMCKLQFWPRKTYRGWKSWALTYSSDTVSFNKILSLKDNLFSFSCPWFLINHFSWSVVWNSEICLESCGTIYYRRNCVIVLAKMVETFLKCFIMANLMNLEAISVLAMFLSGTRHMILITSLL